MSEKDEKVGEKILKKIVEDDEDGFDGDLEISEDDESEESEESEDSAKSSDASLSKHKAQGKHSLKYDSIFKGKKEDPIDEDSDVNSTYFNDNFDIDRGSILYGEYRDNEQYLREKKIKEEVYSILNKKTQINFLNNRRKPSKVDFNNYYLLLTVDLKRENFSHTEIFNELAVYFSDNLFNMFKLLDNKWRTQIIDELQQHIGKNDNSKQINKRNLQIGTEVEFSYIDILEEEKFYTGIIIAVDESSDIFQINSYENVYDIDMVSIIKILNNKFKYNLNKLNNIDFL